MFGKHHPVQKCESAESSMCCQEMRRGKNEACMCWKKSPELSTYNDALGDFCVTVQHARTIICLYLLVQWIYWSSGFTGPVYLVVQCM